MEKEPILVVVRNGCPKVYSLDTGHEVYIIDQRGCTKESPPTIYRANVINKDAKLLREALRY